METPTTIRRFRNILNRAQATPSSQELEERPLLADDEYPLTEKGFLLTKAELDALERAHSGCTQPRRPRPRINPTCHTSEEDLPHHTSSYWTPIRDPGDYHKDPTHEARIVKGGYKPLALKNIPWNEQKRAADVLDKLSWKDAERLYVRAADKEHRLHETWRQMLRNDIACLIRERYMDRSLFERVCVMLDLEPGFKKN